MVFIANSFFVCLPICGPKLYLWNTFRNIKIFLLNSWKYWYVCTNFKSQSNFKSFLVGLIFFGNCSVICLLFMRLTYKWRHLIKIWSKSERVFLKNAYLMPASKWSLKKKMLYLTVIFLLGALLEHSMFFASALKNFSFKVNKCKANHEDFFKAFTLDHLSHLFILYDYRPWLACILEFMNTSFTFYWNFLDLYIMLISLCFAHRFQQINWRVEHFREKVE